MIRVAITDDHALLREGLKKVLREASDITVVAEAGTAAETLEKLSAAACDVLILDVTLPDRNGLEVLKDVKARFPKVRVLILSMHPEERFAVRAMRLGAAGYLTKEAAADELVTAVHRVFSGRKYITPAVAEELATALEHPETTAPHETLSDREHEILCLIASGRSIADISGQLSLSASTISTYRSRILTKMHLTTNAELTYYAVKNGLVD